MPALISAIFGTITSLFSGLFSFKGDQAKTVQSALDVFKSVNDSDSQSVTAAASALQSILTQGSFLERNWRPLLMCILMGILVASFFGFVPTHLNDTVSPTMEKIWTLLQIGLGGYLPLRTLEKVVQTLNIGSILKALVNKKIV